MLFHAPSKHLLFSLKKLPGMFKYQLCMGISAMYQLCMGESQIYTTQENLVSVYLVKGDAIRYSYFSHEN